MRKPKDRTRSESHIKQQVREILSDTGWKFWMPSAGLFGRSGVSDFLAVKQPRVFMAIETKYDDVVTVPQFKFLTDIHEAGHYAFLVDETNVEELRALLVNGLSSYPVGTLMKWQTQNQGEP
jgi:predicted type IV restriction endonuclease